MQGIKRRSEIPCFPRLREHLRQSRPIVVQLFPFRTTSEAGKDGSGSQEGFLSPLRSPLTTALVQGGTRVLILQRPYQAPSQGACGHLVAAFRSALSLCTGGWTHAGNIKSRRCSQRWRTSNVSLQREAPGDGRRTPASHQAVKYGWLIFGTHGEQRNSHGHVN